MQIQKEKGSFIYYRLKKPHKLSKTYVFFTKGTIKDLFKPP